MEKLFFNGSSLHLHIYNSTFHHGLMPRPTVLFAAADVKINIPYTVPAYFLMKLKQNCPVSENVFV